MSAFHQLTTRDWTGYWIEPEQEAAYREPELTFAQMVEAEKSGVPSESHLKPVKHLHRLLALENAEGDLPVQAVVYASAHGVYELYLNGKKADSRILAPETTNYEKLIWYQVYDITDLICESSRASLDVLLGDGWWIGRLGMGGSSCNYGDKLGFIMDLELTYPDGSKTVIGSDEQFLSCDSFIQYSDLYIGEGQDWTLPDACLFYRSVMESSRSFWNQNPADQDGMLQLPDSQTGEHPVWTSCLVKPEESRDILAEQPIPGIQVVREIPYVSFVDVPNGELVADFGQVTAGVVRIRVRAERGDCITLEHGEVLDRDGNYYSNIKGLYKDQKDRFICRGGEQIFRPRFTYHGFRYIRISGIAKEDILELTALVYGTPLEKIAVFETDNVLLNGLQTAIENSTVANMISVPTDCPQREKLGWTGDINIFTGTGAFLYDLREFLNSWLMQVRVDQLPDGEIPVVVPNHPCQDKMQRGMSGGTNSSAAWSDCILFMPLKLYQIYGDISVLTNNFEAMEKWMAYVKAQTEDGLWIHRFHFGDWLIPSLREAPDGVMRGVMATADITGSCYYAMAARAMAKICRILADYSENKNELQESISYNAGDCPSCAEDAGDFLKKAEEYEALYAGIQKAICDAYVYEDGRVGVHAAEVKAAEGSAAETDAVEIRETGNAANGKQTLVSDKATDKHEDNSGEQPQEDLQLQGLYVVVLASGAVRDSALKDRMLRRLVDLIREADYTLDCGFSSIGYLLDVLYDNGYADVAYQLLFSTKAPSWLYMITHGATTIWENWRAIKEDGTVTDSSYNHYAYGCVGDFIYRHIGGIEALAPGYTKVRIAPDFTCGIRRSSCSRKLPGRVDLREITVHWELDSLDTDSELQPEAASAPAGQLHVVIPEGVSAIIVLPTGEFEADAGTYDYRF